MRRRFFSIIASMLAIAILLPAMSMAQKMPKKHKSAPDETIIVIVGKPNPTFNESQYPHLRFYYLPDVSFIVDDKAKTKVKLSGFSQETTATYYGEPEFIVRFGSKRHIASDNAVYGIVVDKNGVVAYQRAFSNSLAAHNDNSDEMNWTILSVARKGIGQKGPLEDYLKDYVEKGKEMKLDKDKSYTPGQEPTYKGWEDGDIEGLELPDFKMVKSDGTAVSIKEVIAGKPSFIVFSALDPDKNFGSAEEAQEKLKEGKVKSGRDFFKSMAKASSGDGTPPMFWHIENVMYNYFPPRK
jgi:hypothetical protein